jgi:hypothetical protein
MRNRKRSTCVRTAERPAEDCGAVAGDLRYICISFFCFLLNVLKKKIPLRRRKKRRFIAPFRHGKESCLTLILTVAEVGK